mmetsp:Transcript_52316/g.86931  ORF Transcript_52316/g.86931 Transcript_52316/m.86931 type:complete len:180 (-) Transcript_52316:71-610(-)|eukprot:CAMPEP_0184369846 /NCGR_PEP_ID=MMETSP1089-20130417/162478_1 /TAXON_ID=38269 ORGANISM="Gloeochaete wittrockiana, Strain SAG46.84" /NCGR_SAMPLE_ID=MMETSP1089 /ASSEMBLY_ACC=CAM_ASM_000445 /LENGTH=179 /DNA_ID=CAMNT_0026712349 /DNA_START=249 /DNA_END=788 /DNA_ORIENTATION=+
MVVAHMSSMNCKGCYPWTQPIGNVCCWVKESLHGAHKSKEEEEKCETTLPSIAPRAVDQPKEAALKPEYWRPPTPSYLTWPRPRHWDTMRKCADPEKYLRTRLEMAMPHLSPRTPSSPSTPSSSTSSTSDPNISPLSSHLSSPRCSDSVPSPAVVRCESDPSGVGVLSPPTLSQRSNTN